MNMNRFNSKIFSMLLLIVLILVTMTACDKRSLDPNTIQLTRLTCDKTELYEDNGANFATLSASVKDNNGFPVLDQTINFRSDNPSISFLPARATTDSSGVAKANVFVSGNILNGQDSLTVTVYAYLGTKKFLSKDLIVRKNPQVTSIVMQGLNVVTYDVNFATEISAVAYGTNGGVLPNGNYITFECNGGYFTKEDGVVTNQASVKIMSGDGTAKIAYSAGTLSGSFTITAKIGNIYAGNPKTVNVKPGIPKLITLEPRHPETNQILTSVPVNSTPINVMGQLTDEWSNPISGKIVTLTSTLGVIPGSITTGENGVYSVLYNPGSVSGIALITAVCDSAQTQTMLNINSDTVQYMKFTNEGTINLSVQGSGGTESATMGVKLYDNIGNVINQPGKRIRFTFQSKPEGCLINNAETAIVETDINGYASVFISSGTQAGIIVLKATLLDENDEDTNVFVTQGRIIVQSGKPHSVAFTIGGYDSGDNVGAGNWKVVIGAIVKDIYGNPVVKGTGVYFTIPEATTTVFGDSVTVLASGFVGNVSADGDSADGTAYSTLIYHGRLSNLDILLKATVGAFDGGDPLTYTGTIKLPMQNMTLVATPQVGYVHWISNGNLTDIQSTYIIVSAIDGQNNPIRKAPLHFNTDRGEFIANADIPNDTNDNLAYTGFTDYNGQCKKKIQFMRMEAQPPQNPPEYVDTASEGSVRIIGTDILNSWTIILRRYY